MTSIAITFLLFVSSVSPFTKPSAEILWDSYGVPHIFAKDANSLFYAHGWAQMQSHANLVLRLYGESRGRGAEYWGKSRLDTDRWIRTVGIPRIATDWLKAMDKDSVTLLESFIEGINAWATANASSIDPAVKVVLPVRAQDVLAHQLRVVHFSFLARQERVRIQGMRWSQAGSNAWAIAPKRSADGKSMLLANPHLPWSDFFLFWEADFKAPGVDVYGATLVGFPMLTIAFNDYLGWTHTVNTQDGADLYELFVVDGGYRFDGSTRQFDVEEQSIAVKDAPAEKLVIKRSIHGPVIAEKQGKALALRVAGLDQPDMIEQYWRMMKARNLKEFEAATSMLQMPMFTILYADRDGHILHVFGGRTPVRSRGDWAYWSGIVPGDTSETLWTRTHPYSDLPRVLDPPSGYLQNANDPPWTTTFPTVLDPDKYPPYMAPRGLSLRAQHSIDLLDQDSSITFDEMIAYKHSTRVTLADRALPDLIAAAKTAGGQTASAVEVLEKWDRSMDANSRGAVLFSAFWMELMRAGGGSPWVNQWTSERPRTTPSGLRDAKLAIAALDRAVGEVTKKYGGPDVAWGEVFRLGSGDANFPGNGGPGDLGLFRVVEYAPARDGKFCAVGGDSFVAAVEFSTPLRARALLTYGNSSQPGSKHAVDQLPIFARKELRPVWRTRDEIEKNLEERAVIPAIAAKPSSLLK
jgi:acyl-homoserine-lactone acylase